MFAHVLQPDDTIVAPATGAGAAALGVIRVSGSHAIEICEKVFSGKSLNLQKSHTIHYGHITDAGETIDEVMVSLFRAPRSFTAENSVEISCHGSQYIQRRIVQALVKHGARLASPGEFTLRAYLNGRLDLAQAEAVGDVIASENSSQLNLALRQMRGGLSEHLQALRTRILDFISLLELELDFGEEDVEFADRSELGKRVEEMLEAIQPVIDSFRYGNAIRNGIPVAIIGRPNAGKSSLLNALLNDDRAIVSEIAGTTRDTIEEEIHIEGVGFRFIDTAGIRETSDSIEKIGIEKAYRKISEAGILIYIYDISALKADELQHDLSMLHSRNPEAAVLVIGNKADLAPAMADHVQEAERMRMLFTSVREGGAEAIEEIRKALWALSPAGQGTAGQAVISNERHHQCLKDAREALYQVRELMENKAGSDLLALELRRAVQSIGDITGLISNEEILGNIFGKFCIGK